MMDSIYDEARLRWVRRRVWSIILVWAVLIFSNSFNVYPIDFSAIYIAARMYAEGAFDLVYPASERFFWETPPKLWGAYADAAAAQFDVETDYYPPYVYPPLWAALFAPVAGGIEFRIAAGLNFVLNLASGVAMILMSASLMRPNPDALLRWVFVAAVVSGISVVARLAYDFGQAQIFVSALVLFSVVQLSRGRDVQAGGWLALAAAIKLSPALFAVIFLMERRWRALAAFMAVGGGLALSSVLIAGWPLHAVCLNKLGYLSVDIHLSRIHLGLNQILLYFDQLFSGGTGWGRGWPKTEAKPAWIDWCIRAILVTALMLIWRVTRRLADGPRLWGRLMLLQLLSILVSPLGWVQNMLLPLMLLPGLIYLRPTREIWACVVVVAVGFSVPCFEFLFGLPLQSVMYVGFTTGLFVVVAIVLAGLSNSRAAS